MDKTDHIDTIKIMLDTNIPGSTPIPLTQSIFIFPENKKTGGENDNIEIGNSENIDENEPLVNFTNNSEYPFFTDKIKYSMDKIKSLSREKQIRLFFNKTEFKKILNDKHINTQFDEQTKHNNANENVMTMLKIFFPISFPAESNIHTSFEDNFNSGSVATSSETYNVIPDFILNLFKQKKTEEIAYLQLNGSITTVTNVVWINDAINHPDYIPFFDKLYKYLKWTIKQKIKNEKKEKKYLIEINEKINNEINDILQLISEYLDPRQHRSRTTDHNSDAYYIKHSKLLKRLFSNKNSNEVIDIIYEIYKLNSKYRQNEPIIPEELYKYIVKYKMLFKTNDFLTNLNTYMKIVKKKDKQKSSENEMLETMQKYPPFIEIINLIKQFTPPLKKTSNPELQQIITKSNDELFNLAKFIHDKIKNKSISNNFENKVLELGVISTSTEPEQNNEEDHVQNRNYRYNDDYRDIDEDEDDDTDEEDDENYESKKYENLPQVFEIFVKIDVVKGQLNSENISQIKCQYENAILTQTYKQLKDPEKNKTQLYKDRPFIDIETLQTETKQNKQSIQTRKVNGGFKTPKTRKRRNTVF